MVVTNTHTHTNQYSMGKWLFRAPIVLLKTVLLMIVVCEGATSGNFVHMEQMVPHLCLPVIDIAFSARTITIARTNIIACNKQLLLSASRSIKKGLKNSKYFVTSSNRRALTVAVLLR